MDGRIAYRKSFSSVKFKNKLSPIIKWSISESNKFRPIKKGICKEKKIRVFAILALPPGFKGVFYISEKGDNGYYSKKEKYDTERYSLEIQTERYSLKKQKDLYLFPYEIKTRGKVNLVVEYEIIDTSGKNIDKVKLEQGIFVN